MLVRSNVWQWIALGLGFALASNGYAAPPARSIKPIRPALKALSDHDTQVFRSLVHSDPDLHQLTGDTLQDRKSTIDNVGDIGKSRLNERRAWVPLAQQKLVRQELAATLLNSINNRSVNLKKLIKSAGDQAAWDTVFIGAGVHSAAMASALSDANPNAKALVIEAGKVVSGNFGNINDGIEINSSNRAETGKPATPGGENNLNPAYGPVNVPDIAGNKWPAARALAEIATISTATSGADIITDSRVSRVSENPIGSNLPRYRIETADGLVVHANKVVVTSGIGRAILPVADDKGVELIKAEASKIDYAKPNDVPSIVSYDQALRLAGLSKTGRDPYRKTSDGREPVIAVIGSGDSGKTFIEYLTGLAPPDAYTGNGKRDVAQRGEVGNIRWVVGSEPIAGVNEFNTRVRPRYARISPSIKNGKVNVQPGKVTAIERIADGPDAGRYRLTYDKPVFDSRTRNMKVENNQYVYTEVVDRVVYNTGFESTVGEVFKDLLPADAATRSIETSSYVEKVNGLRSKTDTSAVPLGKVLKGQDVLFAGPAAGKDVVGKDEIAGIAQNTASIFALLPRSVLLAKQVLARKDDVRAIKTLDTTGLDNEARVALNPSDTNITVPIELDRFPDSEKQVTGASAFDTKFQLARILDRFRYGGLEKLEISFVPRKGEGGKRLLEMNIAGLDQGSATQIATAIQADPVVLDALKPIARAQRPLEVRSDIRNNAKFTNEDRKSTLKLSSFRISQ